MQAEFENHEFGSWGLVERAGGVSDWMVGAPVSLSATNMQYATGWREAA